MVLDKFKLTDQVAVVTGAGRGVGKGIALALAEAGADVVCAARTAEQIEEAAAEVRRRGRRALVVPLDAREAEQMDSLIEKTVAEFGRLDIMVNNVGGSFFSRLIDTSKNGFEAVMRENLTTCFLGSKAAARVMMEHKGGNIINISSRAGQQGTLNVGHYGAAKAAMNNLTEALAWELAEYNIRVNCLCLGPVLTERTQETFKPLKDVYMSDEVNVQGRLLIKRFGLPEDVGAFCVFLASEASSWITGKIYEIDGGMRATPAL
ncbi:SDR family NAD(P)-dependent oxidoreductase [Chloroflexota bacterium]